MNNTPTIDQFQHEATNALPPLLRDDEAPPCTIVKGTKPMIILGPHNGYKVPQSLYDDKGLPLGLPHAWFDPENDEKRHEACDWGMLDLFSTLQQGEHSQHYTYLSSPYSRLVCDLSRAQSECITESSSEDGDMEIPGNLDLTPE